eukprot:scaffold277214_cov22-Tisochrysis_lutea.AAC.1
MERAVFLACIQVPATEILQHQATWADNPWWTPASCNTAQMPEQCTFVHATWMRPGELWALWAPHCSICHYARVMHLYERSMEPYGLHAMSRA